MAFFLAYGEAQKQTDTANGDRVERQSKRNGRPTCVTFRPGRLKLETRPSWTGSLPMLKTMGIGVVAAFAANVPGVVAGRDNHCHRPPNEIGDEGRKESQWPCMPRYSIATFCLST